MDLVDFAVIFAGVLAIGLVITGILHFSGFTRKFREAKNRDRNRLQPLEEIFPGALRTGDHAQGPSSTKRRRKPPKRMHGGRWPKRRRK